MDQVHPKTKRKFLEISDEKLNNLKENVYSKKTKAQTRYAHKTFCEFLQTKNINEDELLKNEEFFDKTLEKFYASLSNLKKATMDSIKYGLNRHYAEYNIQHFENCNKTYKCVLKKLKDDGLSYTQHYPKIEKPDIEKIIKHLDPINAIHLQLLLWFYIQMYFCQRGCENTEEMRKTDFKIETNADGRRYLIKDKDELNKNNAKNDEHSSGGRIYETKTEKCPIKLYEMYINKLSINCDRLWQHPQKNLASSQSCWYNRPVGRNTISQYRWKE